MREKLNEIISIFIAARCSKRIASENFVASLEGSPSEKRGTIFSADTSEYQSERTKRDHVIRTEALAPYSNLFAHV